MKQKYFIVPVAIFTFLLIFFSAASIDTAKSALKLCADSLIPSLFPFFVCSSLLTDLDAATLLSKFLNPIMKPFFGLSGPCSLAIIMGYISGYPIGAKTAADLYISGSCSKDEAEKMLAYCNNSGPMFIIGALGSSMLKNTGAGAMIYLSHILSSLSVAFIMRNASSYRALPKPAVKQKSGSFGEMFTESVSSSAILTLTVCGFVIIFALLISFIEQLGIIEAICSLGMDYSLCKSVIYGLLECSGGCAAVVSAVKNPVVQYMLLSSVLAWSGVSVHLQVLGIIKKAKLSPKLYFKGKTLMAIISPVITFFLYSFKSKNVGLIPLLYVLFLFIITLFSILKICSLLKRIYFKYSALPPR